MHFLMHPQANSVELMSCGKTASTIIDALMQRLPRNGLVPFRVQRESVGFILNRIWAAIKREALMVVQEGVATPEDIDRIWHEVFHSPAAPFRMMDQVGLDVVRDIEEHYAQIREGIPEGPSHTVARVHRSRTSRSEERPGVLLRLSRGRQGWPIKRSDGPGWAGVGRLLIPGFEWHPHLAAGTRRRSDCGDQCSRRDFRSGSSRRYRRRAQEGRCHSRSPVRPATPPNRLKSRLIIPLEL